MRYAIVVLLLITAVRAAAQTSSERLPRFVVDAHAATVGLPQAEGWVPVMARGTELPGRFWGLAGGATVYPLRLGVVTFGVGASIIRGSGRAETVLVTGSGLTLKKTTIAVVHTAATSLVPQVSINFGRKLGWSYLSAGMGRSKASSRSEAIGTSPARSVPETWSSAMNFGGGARWFMKPRIGAGFDVRFLRLPSRAPTALPPEAMGRQLWNISAGISIQ